ncbi:MAG: hypothetical protein NVS4B11_14820 [Ktedonobacteraceae bacterium]
MLSNYVQMQIFSENEVQVLAQNIFNRNLTDGEFASLAGARSGDKVITSPRYDKEDRLIELKMIRPVTIGRRKPNIGVISALSKEYNEPLLTIQLIHIPAELHKQGIGSDIIAIQVKAAQRMGIPQIAAYAHNKEYISGRRYVGYYVFPRLGFDAQLSNLQKQQLPDTLTNKASIGEIMRDSTTREIWRTNGLPLEVTFDTSAESSSIQSLQDYFIRKGLSWEDIPNIEPQVLRTTM